MKTKLIIASLLGLLTLAFVFGPEFKGSEKISYKETLPPEPQAGNEFMIGVLDGGIDNGYGRISGELNTNLWSKYTEAINNRGWVTFHNNWNVVDTRDALLNQYSGYVFDVMDQNNTNNMKTLMMRPKIEYLAYGQRSDYQCESDIILEDQTFWFYAYNIHNDNVSADFIDPQYGNARVRYCRTENSTNSGSWMHSAGYVCEGLRANREQCATYGFSSDYQRDGRHGWIIKPMIRAEKNYVNTHSDEAICRIDVINFNGNLIKSTELKARHFQDVSGNYDGNYKEDNFNFTGTDSTLTFSEQEGINFNPNNGNWEILEPGKPGYSQVDIKVYWYGNCDMWIDYVRVDNDVASDLLSNDNSNVNFIKYQNWLKWEVEDIANTRPNDVFKFYIEEFEFNNRPCMKYVNERIQALSGNQFSLMCNPYWGGYNQHKPVDTIHPYEFTKDEFKETLFEYVGLKEIFMGSYALKGYYNSSPVDVFTSPVYVPSTLPQSGYAPLESRFSSPKPPDEYDQWLQDYLDNPNYSAGVQHGEFRFYNETCEYISKALNIPIYTIVQTHLWYNPTGPIYREPTNEELKLLVNLPIAYGSKGIEYFWFGSWNPKDLNCSYGRGLTDPYPEPVNCNSTFPGIPNVTYSTRHDNVYKQYSEGNLPSSKYQTIADINTKLKAWGPTLMSFDNMQTRSYIYRLERNNLLSETYFYDVASYIWGNDHPICNLDAPDTTDAPPPENLKYECFEDRYLQVATFKTGVNDPDNYFMIVNRRCSPVQPVTHNDGKRYIRVFFDRNSQQLEAFSNWSIIDLASNVVIDVVDIANVTPYADLGWFDPGEGKLYKMVSTVKSGGILAGNEYITGESFTCEAPVYNNGFNITIGANTTIHFNDSSKFVMEGGVFTVGDQNTSAPQNITSDAVPGGSWRGHSFTNCEVKIYGATFTGLANDTTYAVNIIDCPVVDIRNCTFNTNSSLKGGVNAICFNNPFIAINNIYIGSNTFNSSAQPYQR